MHAPAKQQKTSHGTLPSRALLSHPRHEAKLVAVEGFVLAFAFAFASNGA